MRTLRNAGASTERMFWVEVEESGETMVEKTLNRIMLGAQTTEGKIIAILLTLSLALMSWNVTAINVAFAQDGEGQAAPAEVAQTNEAAPAADEVVAPEPEPVAAEPQVEEVVAPEIVEEEAPAVSDEPQVVVEEEEATTNIVEAPEAEQPAAPAADSEKQAAPADENKADDKAADDKDENKAEEKKEIAYPAKVFDTQYVNGIVINVSAPAGALPEGVELVVTPVAASDVVDQVSGLVEGEVTTNTVQAVDISFRWFNPETKQTEEVEPLKPINVKMASETIRDANADDAKNVEIVHIADNGDAEVVPSTTTASNQLSIDSQEFSIYVIVSGTDPDARLIVNFYNESYQAAPIATMSITQSQLDTELETNIYDPGVGELKSGEVFKGWTTNKEYTVADDSENGMDIADVREQIRAKLLEGIEDGTPLNLYAMVFEAYHVSYRDELGVTIYTDEVLYRDGDTVIPYTFQFAYTPYYVTGSDEEDETKAANFDGWAYVDTTTDPETLGTVYQNGDEVNMATFDLDKQNQTLTVLAQVAYGHWLVFNENGSGATFTPPLFVATDKTPETAGMPANPTRPGYEFQGWYADQACTTPFDTTQPITQTAYAWAKWKEAATTNFRVLVWYESLEGGYSFEKSIVIENATTGAEMESYLNAHEGDSTVTVDDQDVFIPLASNENTANAGFIYEKCDSNNEGKVASNGTSVLNVYFERQTYNLKFYYARERNGNYQVSSNYDATNPGIWNGSGSTEPGCSFGKKGTETNGRYTYLYSILTAEYGADISGAWPTYDQFSTFGNYRLGSWAIMHNSQAYIRDGQGTVKGKITVMNEEILGDLSSPDGNYLYANYDTASSQYDWTYNIYFKNGNGDYELYESVSARSHDPGTNWATQQHPPAYPGMEEVRRERVGNNLEINYYYDPLSYPILFKDGVYEDGNQTELADKSGNTLSALQDDKAIAYKSDVSEYNNFDPTDLISDGANYVFLGWYTDSACTQKYTFGTMPIDGITVYAKWVLKEYMVTLHPNDDGDPTFAYVNGKPAGQYTPEGHDYFWLNNGEKVANVGGTRDVYDLIGWFANENLSKVWDFDAFTLNDTIVGKYGELYDLDGTDDRYDPAYPGTVGEINLYASWRRILDGADGINVEYTATGKDNHGNTVVGTDAPTDPNKYSDQAQAIARPAAKAPAAAEGEQQLAFQSWVVQKWNGTAYVDTDQEVFPGDRFRVKYEDAQETPGTEAGTKIYTIRLRAQYGAPEEATLTHIAWYNNYTNSAEGIIQNNPDLGINETVAIPAAPTRAGYDFLGWAKATETNADDEVIYIHDELTEDNLFLTYDKAAKNYTFTRDGSEGQVTSIATGVFADEKVPYDGLYAVWAPIDVNYKVEFYYMNDAGEYAIDSTMTATRTAETESTVKATAEDEAQTKDGDYTLNAAKSTLSATVAGDGSTVLALYFDLAKAKITVEHYLLGQTTAFKTDTVSGNAIGETFAATPETTYQEKTLTVNSADPENRTITVQTSGNVIKIYYTLPLTITAATTSQTYNGNPLVGSYSVDGALAADATAINTALGTAPSITHVADGPKQYLTEADQAKITGIPAYYVVSYVPGTLTVTPATLTVKTESASKTYNGIALTAAGNVTGFVTPTGGVQETATFTVTGSQTLVGESQNTYTLEFNGAAQATDYTVSKNLGTLKVIEPVPDDYDEVAKKSHDGKDYELGKEITWTIEVTNVYDEPKDITLVEKDGFTLAQSTFENVRPGVKVTTTATYVVTEADILAGKVDNTVQVKFGKIDIPVPDPNPAVVEDLDTTLAVNKQVTNEPANGEAFVLGETIEYSITIENKGNVAYHNIKVVDELTKLDQTIELLSVGATVEYTTSYTVTEADIVAGNVKNVVTAKGDPIDDPKHPDQPKTPEGEDTTTTGDKDDPDGPVPPVEQKNAHITVAKEVTSEPADADGYVLGETIAYSITATNDGNVTLNDVVVTDELTGDKWTVEEPLAPGENATFETTYTVTAEDVAAGTVLNVATADGVDPEGDKPTPTPGENEQPTAYKLVVNYVYEDGSEAAPTYSDALKAGAEYNVTLPAINGYHPVDAAGNPISALIGNMPAQDVEVTITYVADPAPEPGTASIAVSKVATPPAAGETYNVGDVITYTIYVTNNGDVTLTNVALGDQMAGIAGEQPTLDGATIATLAPDETRTFTVAYTVVVGDAGNTVSNSVVVTATNPDDPDTPVTDTYTTPGEPITPPTPVPPAPAPTPVVPVVPAAPAAPAVDVPAAPAVDIPAAPAAPAATITIDDTGTPLVEAIDDDANALAGPGGAWSLFDLIATILTALLSLVMVVRAIGRNRKEGDDDEQRRIAYANGQEPEEDQVIKRKRIARILSLIPGIGSIILFVLTQDLTQPMVIFDWWSIVFAIAAIINIVLAVVTRKKSDDDDEEEQQQAGYAPMTA